MDRLTSDLLALCSGQRAAVLSGVLAGIIHSCQSAGSAPGVRGYPGPNFDSMPLSDRFNEGKYGSHRHLTPIDKI